jgi:AraC-like DNA-binding protein
LARALGAAEDAWQPTGQFRQVLWVPPADAGLSDWLLGVSLLETGTHEHRFALPAHALCVCSWVLQGSLAVAEARRPSLSLGSAFGSGPSSRPTPMLAAPGTRVLGLLMPARILPLATGQDAALARDRPLSPPEQADVLSAILWVAQRCLGAAWPEPPVTGCEAQPLAHRLASLTAELPAAQQLLRALTTEERLDAALSSCGLSARQAQRLCSRHFGLPPVKLSRLFRLHRCTSRQLTEPGSGADAALAAGYFDQAHMARDFRQLAELPPGSLADEQRSWALRAGATVLAPAYLGRD